jgi:glycosyltransferase A (GT-A) superfamily protein (DUF2064 family)
MQWAVSEALATGARRVLLRGSDSPTLDEAAVATALHALDDHDLALRPDRDGGYTLVGVRREAAQLFAHPMSSDRVLEQTLENAGRLGFSTAIGEIGFDVDTGPDLSHLRHILGQCHEGVCPHTRRWLQNYDLCRNRDLA